MDSLIPQIIGLLAVATFVLSYQQKKRRSIIITNIISRLLYIVQYLLLGAISGVVLDLLGMISSLIAERKNLLFVKRHLKILFLSVNIIIIIAGLIIAVENKSLLDVFPIIGVLLHTNAFWISDEKIIRRISLLGSPFWFVYNFLRHAYGSAIGDVLTIVSIIISMKNNRQHKCPN